MIQNKASNCQMEAKKRDSNQNLSFWEVKRENSGHLLLRFEEDCSSWVRYTGTTSYCAILPWCFEEVIASYLSHLRRISLGMELVFVAKIGISSAKYSSYLLDLPLCDFDLFRKLHLPTRGAWYTEIPFIQMPYTDIPRSMPAKDLKFSLEKLLSSANQCIGGEGDYFE